jgi:hypothetical protein
MGIFRDPLIAGTIVDKRILRGGMVPDGPGFRMPDISRADYGPSTVTPPGGRYQPMHPAPDLYQLKLRHGRRTSWVTVEPVTFNRFSNGAYIDLANPYPAPPAPIAPAARMKCTIDTLSASFNISDEERELWNYLSDQLMKALQFRPGGPHTLRIKGVHDRSQCPDPHKYWGTILLALQFDDQHQHGAKFVAKVDKTRFGRQILVRHHRGTFEAFEHNALERIVNLAFEDLGV